MLSKKKNFKKVLSYHSAEFQTPFVAFLYFMWNLIVSIRQIFRSRFSPNVWRPNGVALSVGNHAG